MIKLLPVQYVAALVLLSVPLALWLGRWRRLAHSRAAAARKRQATRAVKQQAREERGGETTERKITEGSLNPH